MIRLQNELSKYIAIQKYMNKFDMGPLYTAYNAFKNNPIKHGKPLWRLKLWVYIETLL